ncbi:aflatoxin B1 aldehyde reductase member 3 [Tothia fuscella]|uniref:Aflatoxin B1 aldehyde reductase member 3 n=1 Tax=Tothia fuscella TaxID=1048955 RepID=A0A9P4NK89_9PEZI|nr:aflatoxin B1 aldehyde reductase member 3 [Tothia fuscella]
MPLVALRPKDRIILGLMTFGPDSAAGARITDLGEYNKILDYFQLKGYNEVDTARAYIGGKQEAFTAAAGWKDRGLTLATKHYPFEPGQHSPEKIRAANTTSLSELKTDCVDIYYLHAADRSVPFEETLKEVNDMHKEGKFVQLGLSNFTSFEVAEVVMICKQNGWVRPTVYQGMYNAITRNIDGELFAACRRYGLDIVVYNPIAGGLFSGKVKLGEIPKDGRFSDEAKSGAMYRKRYFKDATFDALALIEPVVKKNNLTLIETALRWCVHHSKLKIKDGNDGIIIGVSSLEQLEGNLRDLEKGPLPEEVVKVLDDAWLVAKPTSVPYWHLDLKYTYDFN